METYMMMFATIMMVILPSITTITICRETVLIMRRGVKDIVEYSLLAVLSATTALVSSAVLGITYGINF